MPVDCDFNRNERRDVRKQICEAGSYQASVGEEQHLQAQTAGEQIEFLKIRAQEWFAAGETNLERSKARGFFEDALDLGSIKLLVEGWAIR